MKATLNRDMSSTLKKGDAPPKGQEARYVRAGLADVAEDEISEEMLKKDLLIAAKSRGIEVDPKATKAQIVEAINAG